MTNLDPTQRVRAFYRQYAPRYDQQTAWYDRVLLGDGRAWACTQSRGAVLEVAIGTGRNLPYYPRDRRLTGIDLTPAMLDLARDRARELGLAVALVVADAQALPFAAASFDSVVCTLGLNAIPDDRAAVAEMYRVLRPGGRLVLVEGRWSTGAGLTADQTAGLVSSAGLVASVERLDDPAYWGRPITDERYAVSAVQRA